MTGRLRMLFIPFGKSWNSQQEFESKVKAELEFFIRDTPLVNCPTVIEISFAALQRAKKWRDYVYDTDEDHYHIRSRARMLGFNPDNFDRIVAVLKGEECNVLGRCTKYNQTLYVTVGSDRIGVLAHELGHSFGVVTGDPEVRRHHEHEAKNSRGGHCLMYEAIPQYKSRDEVGFCDKCKRILAHQPELQCAGRSTYGGEIEDERERLKRLSSATKDVQGEEIQKEREELRELLKMTKHASKKEIEREKREVAHVLKLVRENA